MFTKEFELAQNDRIIITLQGVEYRGKVLSASFYGPRDGWYIEMRSDKNQYHYWKQGPDGGTVWKNPQADTVRGGTYPTDFGMGENA